ncbi:pachytene checkpoint protein 2 homolog isoform X1 [Anabrus simplex]|uniref:pachytene checkpoint protein 2 homolog isoform X1 n=1 Tax=Anabrus simplex TaxID=316456 RepID=UPI0034DD803D
MANVLHIEILQRLDSVLSKQEILNCVQNTINTGRITPGQCIQTFEDPVCRENIESIIVSEVSEEDTKNLDMNKIDVQYHVYRLDVDGPQTETMGPDSGDGDEIPASTHWILPSYDLHGLWESLVYDFSVKQNLLDFVETTLLFSDHGVNTNFISWNRVVLLHGPPGTGKTSLCRALAQKLSIRLGHRYSHGELIEVNSHSLFSKWFSESGKLVMKMFMEIRELLENPRALVFVLIDEVESLTHARQSSLMGTEPSDSIRVVNALLTQIDQLRRFPNAIILTTSNITDAIDLAFVDRADIKQYIGPPSLFAIYKIYHSCISELQRTGIVDNKDSVMSLRLLQLSSFDENDRTQLSLQLLEVARQSIGLSGRTLRKIPFLAHAYFLHTTQVSLEKFIDAMKRTVTKNVTDCESFKRSESK